MALRDLTPTGDLTPTEIAELLSAAIGIQSSLNSLNATIAQSEADLVVKLTGLTMAMLNFGQSTVNLTRPILTQVEAGIPTSLRYLAELTGSVTRVSEVVTVGRVILLTVIFFGVGSIVFSIVFFCAAWLFTRLTNRRRTTDPFLDDN